MRDDVGFSISQFRDAWRLLCGASPGYAADGNGAVEYIFSGLPIPFFNVALVTGRDVSVSALQIEARQACEWATPRSVPWMCIVTHEALAPDVDAASVLDSHATDAGRPVYERMGYEPVAAHTAFIEKRFLEGH